MKPNAASIILALLALNSFAAESPIKAEPVQLTLDQIQKTLGIQSWKISLPEGTKRFWIHNDWHLSADEIRRGSRSFSVREAGAKEIKEVTITFHVDGDKYVICQDTDDKFGRTQLSQGVVGTVRASATQAESKPIKDGVQLLEIAYSPTDSLNLALPEAEQWKLGYKKFVLSVTFEK